LVTTVNSAAFVSSKHIFIYCGSERELAEKKRKKICSPSNIFVVWNIAFFAAQYDPLKKNDNYKCRHLTVISVNQQ
jgi:hypothetical protein